MWYKNHTHADWGLASWHAVVAAISSRTWDSSISDHAMAERFASLVRCIDVHLPDGIQDIIRVWFETAGAERMIEVVDEEWHMMEHMVMTLSCGGILPPQTVLEGLVYPVWNRSFQTRGTGSDSGSLLRTLPLASAMFLCDPQKHNMDADIVLQLESCRARCSRPSNIATILRGMHALAVLGQANSVDPTIMQQVESFRQRLIQDDYLRRNVLSRTRLQEQTFEKLAAEYPDLKHTMVSNLKECLRNEWSLRLGDGE